MERRELLKRAGGIGAVAAVGGGGVLSFSGGAAASTVNITASNPGSVSNDRGDVTEVTANPDFHLHWQNLDDAVGKVFYLVEAKVGDNGSWQPIFRATPWLTEPANTAHVRQKPGTTGMYKIKTDLASALNSDPRFSDGSGPDASAGPLVVADEQGKPDYASIDFSTIGGVDLQSFLDGTSMGSASNYPGAHEAGGHQNNYPDVDAGYYGAAADTSALDNEADGTSAGTNVYLRYTFELQRPNLSQLQYHPDVDFSGLSTDEAKKQAAADSVDWVEVSDIDAGNSRIVMNGEDGNAAFGPNYADGAGITYAALRNNASNHVGILVTNAKFVVTAVNEGSSSGVSGDSGANAS